MADDEQMPGWRTVGETVAGASHARAGVPNQDALCLPEPGAGFPVIAAVSDGHGSAKCFRSHKGSQFAVAVAADAMRDFLSDRPGDGDLSELEQRAREWLPREVTTRWRAAVEGDLASAPLSPEELDTLREKEGASARELIAANPLLAYGATVLTVAVGESFLLYLQLGDGDILTVSEAGEVTRPLPRDERLFANETTSLCSPSASSDFRVGLQTLSDSQPALVLLSTDGYANSFPDDAGFLKVGSDIFETVRSQGLDTVKGDMKAWLEETTRLGSGDDITLAIVCRTNAFPQPAERAAAAPAETEPRGEPPEPASEQPLEGRTP